MLRMILPLIFALFGPSTVQAETRPPGKPAGQIASRPLPSGEAIERLLLDERHDEAARLLNERLQADPDDGTALLTLAVLSEGSGRPAAARTLRQRALLARPLDDETIAATARDQWPQSGGIARLRDRLAERPDSPALHFALGNALASLQRWPEAALAWRDALSLEPGQPDCLFNLAIAEEQQGRSASAADLYRAALTARQQRPGIFPTDLARQRLELLEHERR